MLEAQERLQKLLSEAGIASRRKAELLIQEGRVTVNGRIVTQLGTKVSPAVDEVRVDGQKVTFSGRHVYLMLNKPRGVVSAMEDTQGHRALGDLVQVPQRVYPVGRLDVMSEGLILLTDDGELANLLTHPRYEHEKEYRALVNGIPSEETLEAWRRGIVLEGRQTAPAQVELVKKEKDSAVLRVIMHEGRKRQIREVAAMLGHPVRQLQRVRLGPLHLGVLRPGEWRHLTEAEVEQLTGVKRKAAAAELRSAGKKRAQADGKAAAEGRPRAQKPLPGGEKPPRPEKGPKPTVQEGKRQRSVPPAPTRPVKVVDKPTPKPDKRKKQDKGKRKS